MKQFGFTADTVPVFVRGVLSMQNMKYSKDYTAWMANAESLGALLEAKIHLSKWSRATSSDEDDDEDEEPAEEVEASPGGSAAIRMGNGLLCDLGQSQRQGWSESGGSSFGGNEGTLPTDFYSDNGEPGRKWWPAMSLPKRDGVQGRYYLIQKPDTNPEVLWNTPMRDCQLQDVLDGTAKENRSGYPVVVRNQSGTPFLPSQLLERYLSKLPLKGFPYEEAVTFCDALRRLVGWREIGHTLGKYIKHQVQERFFEIGENEDYFSPFPLCTAWPELRPEDICEDLLRFTCYVAVCYTVYGASDNTIITEHYLDLVSQLRPDMVKQLKTAGSGKLPKDHPAA